MEVEILYLLFDKNLNYCYFIKKLILREECFIWLMELFLNRLFLFL